MRSQLVCVALLLIATLCGANQWFFIHAANGPALEVLINTEPPFSLEPIFPVVQDVPAGNVEITVVSSGLSNATVLIRTNITVNVNETGTIVFYGSTEANATTPLAFKAIASPNSIADNTTNYFGFFNALYGAASVDAGVEVVNQFAATALKTINYGEFTGFDAQEVPSSEAVLDIVVNGTSYPTDPAILKMGSIYLVVIAGYTDPTFTLAIPVPVPVYDEPTYGTFRFGHFLANVGSLDVTLDDEHVGNVDFGNVDGEVKLRLGLVNVTVSGAAMLWGIAPEAKDLVVDGYYTITLSNSTASPAFNTYNTNRDKPSFLTGTKVTVISLVEGATTVKLTDTETGLYSVDFDALAHGETATQDVPTDNYDIHAYNDNNTVIASALNQNFVQYTDVTVFVGSGVITVKEDNTFPIPSSIAYVRFVHAAPKLDEEVELLVEGGVLAKNASFGEFPKYVNYTWPANETTVSRTFTVRESNSGLVHAEATVILTNNRNYTVAFIGVEPTVNATSPYDYAVAVYSDVLLVGSASALIRYINLVPANETLSVTLEDVKLPDDWRTAAYPTSTRYFAFAALSADVSLDTEKNESLQSESFSFENGTAYSVWAIGSAGDERLVITQDFPAPSKKSGLTSLELGLIIGGAILFAILLLAIVVFVVRSNRAEGYEQIGSPSYDR
jgi:hypothetical protein